MKCERTCDWKSFHPQMIYFILLYIGTWQKFMMISDIMPWLFFAVTVRKHMCYAMVNHFCIPGMRQWKATSLSVVSSNQKVQQKLLLLRRYGYILSISIFCVLGHLQAILSCYKVYLLIVTWIDFMFQLHEGYRI